MQFFTFLCYYLQVLEDRINGIEWKKKLKKDVLNSIWDLELMSVYYKKDQKDGN